MPQISGIKIKEHPISFRAFVAVRRIATSGRTTHGRECVVYQADDHSMRIHFFSERRSPHIRYRERWFDEGVGVLKVIKLNYSAGSGLWCDALLASFDAETYESANIAP